MPVVKPGQGAVPAAAPAAPATPKPAPAKAAAPAAPKTAPVAPAPDAGVDRLFDPGSHKRGGFEGRFDDPEVAKMTAEWAVANKEAEQLPVFMDKLSKVRELRRQGLIGPQAPKQIGLQDVFGGGRAFEYPSMRAIEVQTGKPKHGFFATESERRGIISVGPTGEKPERMPSEEDLNLPAKGAQKAETIANEYAAARLYYRQRKAVVESAKNDPKISPAKLAPLAQASHAALMRVAQLRAQLREFGWMDDAEVERKFAPK